MSEEESQPTHGTEPNRPTPWNATGKREVSFHYDRAEREALRHDAWKKPQGGFFRRNKGLTLSIIDVAFVLVLLLVYLIFLRPLAERTRIGGYRIEGEAVLFDGEVLVGVTVDDTSPDDRSALPQVNRVVTLSALGLEARDLVPASGGRRVVRLRIPEERLPDEVESGLTVTVTIGDETRSLTVEITGEARSSAR